jgi:hypothetical protein
MTDPADTDQFHNNISSEGAIIKRHEELLLGLLDGFQTLAERYDCALNTLLDNL